MKGRQEEGGKAVEAIRAVLPTQEPGWPSWQEEEQSISDVWPPAVSPPPWPGCAARTESHPLHPSGSLNTSRLLHPELVRTVGKLGPVVTWPYLNNFIEI